MSWFKWLVFAGNISGKGYSDPTGSAAIGQAGRGTDLLSGIKIQTDAATALTWKAAHKLEYGPGQYDARGGLASAAKVIYSEAAVKTYLDAITVVGM